MAPQQQPLLVSSSPFSFALSTMGGKQDRQSSNSSSSPADLSFSSKANNPAASTLLIAAPKVRA